MIFIKENIPSSKNSKRIVRLGSRHSIINSQLVMDYKSKTKDLWNDQNTINQFRALLLNKEKPYKIGFHFVRDSKRKFDFVGPLETVQDLMTKAGWIEDDNTSIMYPFPLMINNAYHSYDKENSGVFIEVL